MDSRKRRYNDFNQYLKATYGERVSRLPIDTSLNCPNRTGYKKGCIYCLDGSASKSSNREKPVHEQIREQIEKASIKKKPVQKFIAYFQAYTNTYASPEKLGILFSPVSNYSEIVALAIGTRPDCIDNKKLLSIKKAAGNKDIWMEYGLQSISAKTLRFIKRGHGIKAFQKAVSMTRKCHIKTGAHVILGFPWETKKEIKRLAQFLTSCRIDFLKIHLLHVLKGTPLEILYKKKQISLPTFNEYISMVALLLEHLPGSVVIQRLTGEGTKETHMAPKWALDKTKVIEAINNDLAKRNSFQGKFA